MKRAVAAGTSIFIVIITALIASLSHFYFLFTHFAADSLLHVLSIIIVAAPGVIIGAQLGVRLAQRINTETTKKILFALFTLIGRFTLAELVL